MATKLDRIRAKVLEYDNYSNALERFLALSEEDRKLALTDTTMRGYLSRASDAGITVECYTVRALLAPPKALPDQITDFLEQVALGNSEYDSISLSAAELLEKYTGRKVGTPNAN